MKRISIISFLQFFNSTNLFKITVLLGFVVLFTRCDNSDSNDDAEPDPIISVPSDTNAPTDDPVDPSEPCTLNEDCGADSFFVLNLGCVEEANAINNSNLLANAGFETNAFGSPFPTAAGGWSGDIVSQVGAENGVVPPQGDSMLRFDVTDNISASSAIASEIAQIYVLTDAQKAQVNAGETIGIRLEAYFNRVAGNENTDTQFLILLMAFDGATEDFRSKFIDRENQALALESATFFSDDCINTWEKSMTEFNIPSGTDYIGVLLLAAENIQNDGEGLTEFDGHYADAVSLYIVE